MTAPCSQIPPHAWYQCRGNVKVTSPLARSGTSVEHYMVPSDHFPEESLTMAPAAWQFPLLFVDFMEITLHVVCRRVRCYIGEYWAYGRQMGSTDHPPAVIRQYMQKEMFRARGRLPRFHNFLYSLIRQCDITINRICSSETRMLTVYSSRVILHPTMLVCATTSTLLCIMNTHWTIMSLFSE